LIDKKSEKFNNIKNANEFNLKSILEYTTPIALSTMLTWILAVSDQIILKEFVSFSDLGNYAIGYRVIVVIKIFTSLFLLYYPILYFEEADKNRFNAINKIRFLFIVMLVFVTVVLVLFRRYIYILMGADQYLDFTHIFSLLVVAELLRIISGFFLTFRAYTLQTWYTMIIVGMSAVISIILNLIFIPSFGIISAAYIQVAVSIIYLIATYFLAIKPEKKFFKNEIKYN
jgi:O-antigen/teichoic acid export membrane protein